MLTTEQEKPKRLVAGVGVNDADYKVHRCEGGKIVWVCPFYLVWSNMLERCYSEKLHERRPTYKGCTVVEEWKLFSNFKLWMDTHQWEGKQLDKDILLEGNKLYSPDTCAFVDANTNKIANKNLKAKGKYATGVVLHKPSGLFRADCYINGKRERLGHYKTEQEAESMYLICKAKAFDLCANNQTDNRVKIALRKRADKDRAKSDSICLAYLAVMGE